MDNPLLQATSEEEVNRLLAEGYPINGFTIEPDFLVDYEGYSPADINVFILDFPLFVAIKDKNVEVVRALLDNGANPNCSLWTEQEYHRYFHPSKPLFLAISQQAPLIIIRYLVEAGARLAYGEKKNALRLSFTAGSEYLVDYFMKEQGMVFKDEYLKQAIKTKNPDFLDYLFSDQFPVKIDVNTDKGRPLELALITKDIHIVDRLIIAGADPTIYGPNSPLAIACGLRFYEAIVRLIETWPDSTELRSNYDLAPPSFPAVWMENLEMVRYVLMNSDLGALDEKGNSIMHSCFHCFSESGREKWDLREEMFRMVLELANRQEEGLGARLLEAPNKDGETPLLSWYNDYSNVNVLEYWHRLGVNFRVVNNHGENIFHFTIGTRGNLDASLDFLAEIFPEGLYQTNYRGQTPLMAAQEINARAIFPLQRLMRA